MAIGGHEGVIALFEVAAAAATPRRSRRRSTSCATRPTSASTRSAWSPSTSGPGCSPGCASGWPPPRRWRSALRVPMIGISSLDLLAFPHRRADRVVVPVVDARKGEVFYAMYRPVPGGMQQVDRRRGRPGRRARRPTCWRAARTRCCVGDGALRYRDRDRGRVPLRARRRGAPERRCRWCSSPTPVRCARSGRSPAEIQPLYLRPPDAQINWATRAWRGHVSERVFERANQQQVFAHWCAATGSDVASVRRTVSILDRRSHARHDRADADPPRRRRDGDRARRLPAAVDRPVFHDELDEARSGRRHYVVARRGRTVVGYGGLMFVADEAHVTNIAVHPGRAPSPASPRGSGVARRRGDRARLHGVDAGGAGETRGAQELYRTFGFAPAGMRKDYYENRGRHRDVVPRHPVRRVPPAPRPAGSCARAERP